MTGNRRKGRKGQAENYLAKILFFFSFFPDLVDCIRVRLWTSRSETNVLFLAHGIFFSPLLFFNTASCQICRYLSNTNVVPPAFDQVLLRAVTLRDRYLPRY